MFVIAITLFYTCAVDDGTDDVYAVVVVVVVLFCGHLFLWPSAASSYSIPSSALMHEGDWRWTSHAELLHPC